MKIFFTASYEGKKYYQKYYDVILDAIQTSGAKLISPEVTREYLDAFRPENIHKLGDRDRVHYEFIRQGIANADAVIIEASHEDFRVGHEATLAIIYKKPVLCLSINKDYGRLIRHEAFRGAQYTINTLRPLVLRFLSEVGKTLLAKRKSTFHVIPHRKTETSSKFTIAVLGSANVDLVTKVPHIPKINDVLISEGLKLLPGGKATNAAIGLSRLAEHVYLLGKIGNDSFGEEVVGLLKREGVKTEFVDIDSFIPTGTVMVTVDNLGKNTIVVNEDANIRINQKTIMDFMASVDDGTRTISCFYTTLEPLPEIVKLAITECNKRNIMTFCDAAPQARPLPTSLYSAINILSGNEFEVGAMAGMPVSDPTSAGKAAQALQKKGANTVIVTLGHLGAVLLPKDAKKPTYFPGNKVRVVDETGAGDAFRAGFVSEYLRSKNLKQAMNFANLVGAYAVTKLGTYDALPTREELEFLEIFPTKN